MLKDHIISLTDDQVSLQHESFKDAALTKKITTLLKFYPGVKKVNLDGEAGVLEIQYDAQKLDQTKVMELLAKGEAWLANEK